MSLRIYEDAALSQMLSRDGAQINPDDEADVDGGSGATLQKALWVAPEQTTLNGGIDNQQTTITLAAARFADQNYPIIVIDGEKMLITGGFGTTSLTVVRGYHDTTPASHADGAAVRAAYDYSSNSIDCTDNEGTDESSWTTYCLDSGGSPDGNWQAPLALSDINYDESLAIWRKIVVPADTAPIRKVDLEHSLSFDAQEIS